MIVVEKPESRRAQCRCCYSLDNVIEICFMAYNNGTAVSLCESCRKELIEKLKMYTRQES